MAKSTRNKDQIKNSELAKIHVAKTRLGMDDDTYRAMLKTIIDKDPAHFLSVEGRTKRSEGVISAKYLTESGRHAVLEHLKNAGFNGGKTYPGRPHNTDSKTASTAAQLKKVEALLADAGRPWDYALNMAWHMYKKHKLEFCNSRELTGIITALVKDQKKRELALSEAEGEATNGR